MQPLESSKNGHHVKKKNTLLKDLVLIPKILFILHNCINRREIVQHVQVNLVRLHPVHFSGYSKHIICLSLKVVFKIPCFKHSSICITQASC